MPFLSGVVTADQGNVRPLQLRVPNSAAVDCWGGLFAISAVAREWTESERASVRLPGVSSRGMSPCTKGRKSADGRTKLEVHLRCQSLPFRGFGSWVLGAQAFYTCFFLSAVFGLGPSSLLSFVPFRLGVKGFPLWGLAAMVSPGCRPT